MAQSETLTGPVWNRKLPRIWTAWNHGRDLFGSQEARKKRDMHNGKIKQLGYAQPREMNQTGINLFL